VNGSTSAWRAVTGNVPQGSILGPVLFNVFVNFLDAGVEYTFNKYIDDTKLGGAVDSLEVQELLQRDLDRLEHWTIINGMKFNKSKCPILHLEPSNTRHKYKLGERWLEQSCKKGSVGPGQQQAQSESAVCPGSPESKPHPRVHQTQRNRLVKRSDYPAVFSTAVFSP